MSQIININNLSKSFNVSNNNLVIFKNISITLKLGSIVSIIGPSGTGKSTFLNILGLLDREYLGEYEYKNKNTKKLTKSELNYTRGSSIGFVHQFFHLIPELNVIENVMLPYLINTNKSDGYLLAKNLLELFGLKDRITFKPIKLSGGEQQRVAIARSLINDPDLLIADEMTGNLDEYTANEIFSFFLNYVKKNNKTLIYATHNNEYANKADSVFKFSNLSLNKIK